MKAVSPIVVLCENDEGRAAAVAFCDRLVKQFWSSCEFDIHWLSFDDLSNQTKFNRAVSQARSAAMLICSMRPGSDIPHELQAWAEAWLPQRGEREGSIIAL